MKKEVILGLISILSVTANGQFLDNYGLQLGLGLSNQYWNYKNNMFSNLSGWKDNKTGFIAQVYAEKNFGRYFSLKPTIGYIQKGFKDDITLTTEEGEDIAVVNNKVLFHDLSLGLVMKIIPIDKSFKPYIIGGFRGNYMIDYRSVIIDQQGVKNELNTELYDDFNKFTIDAVIGIGISYNDLLFLDMEYAPPVTKNFESSALEIHDRYFCLTLGLNLNSLIKKQKTSGDQ